MINSSGLMNCWSTSALIHFRFRHSGQTVSRKIEANTVERKQFHALKWTSDDYQQSLYERNKRSASYPTYVQHFCTKTLSVPSAPSSQKQTLNVMFLSQRYTGNPNPNASSSFKLWALGFLLMLCFLSVRSLLSSSEAATHSERHAEGGVCAHRHLLIRTKALKQG